MSHQASQIVLRRLVSDQVVIECRQVNQVTNQLEFSPQIQLVFPTIVTGNMPEYVTEPHKFYPERWIKHNATSTPGCPHSHEIHPFASLPYGHGARMCLGRRFADLEMQILLSKVSLIKLCPLEVLIMSYGMGDPRGYFQTGLWRGRKMYFFLALHSSYVLVQFI